MSPGGRGGGAVRRIASSVVASGLAICATTVVLASEVTVEPGVVAHERAEGGITVVVTPQQGDDWRQLASRLFGDEHAAEQLARALGARPSTRRPFEVTFESLSPGLQRRIVTALLPNDRCVGDQWQHKPQASFAPDASFEQLAGWFGATAEDRRGLERALRAGPSGILDLPCRHIAPWLVSAMGCCQATAGDDLLLARSVPPRVTPTPVVRQHEATVVTESAAAPTQALDLLSVPSEPPKTRSEPGAHEARSGPAPDARRSKVPAPAQQATAAVQALAAPPLDYRSDADGAYAIYRLRAGEAVYSAVILRFTDRVHASDVDELTRIIARRSEVDSFHDLPVGFPVKVPLEYLAAEFRPLDDPKRQEFERHRQEIAKFRKRDVVTALEGVVVILDPGHGGTDRGAANNGVWESDFVYDIMCRIRRHLQSRTRAKVLTLVHNDTLGHEVRGGTKLKPLSDSYVMTQPRYLLRDTKIGVNLRWYLANSMYRELVESGTDRTRVVFTSIHADSLHSSVHGAMVYVPGAEHTAGRHGTSESTYKRYREVRQQRVVSHRDRDRIQAEALSRDFAGHVLDAFHARGLSVHEQKPIRSSVLRNRSEWLPAVLRANQIPARVLLEVCNLNHKDDSRLLASPAFRQGVAEAYVDALLAYFGGDDEVLVAKQATR